MTVSAAPTRVTPSVPVAFSTAPRLLAGLSAALLALAASADASAQAPAAVSRAADASSTTSGDVALGIGVASLVAGGATAVAGTTVDRCGGPEHASCSRMHYGLLFGGVGFAALGGGIGFAIGARLRRGALGGAPPEDAPTHRADRAMWAIGLTVSLVGAAAGTAGFVMSAFTACSASNPPSCQHGAGVPAGAVLLTTGAAALAVGLPLVIVGGRSVPDAPAARLTVAPGAIGIAGQF